MGNLLDFIVKQSVWKLHGLLRALHLTDQGHVIRELGWDPADYEDDKQVSKLS